MSAFVELLLVAPRSMQSKFWQDGRFFQGADCRRLSWLLRFCKALPLPTRAQLLDGLEKAAGELEMGSGSATLCQDAQLLHEQWRLRRIARRSRCFLHGLYIDPRGKVATMLREIGALHDAVVNEVKGHEDEGFLPGGPECRPNDAEAMTMSDLFSPAGTAHDEEATVHDDEATVHDEDATVHDEAATVHKQEATVHDEAATVHDEEATVHEPATEAHAEPEEPPTDEATDEAAGAGSSTGAWSPAQAATNYRSFLASVKVDTYPPPVRYSVQRALWHEFRGALKDAKKCLNEALRKGGYPALNNELQQGAVREHLACLELPPEAAGGMPPRRCNRCRKPAGQCAPSCLRREQDKIRRQTARLEAQMAANRQA